MNIYTIIVTIIVIVIVVAFMSVFIFICAKDKFIKLKNKNNVKGGGMGIELNAIKHKETELINSKLITCPEDFLLSVNNGIQILRINDLVFETLCNRIERMRVQRLNGMYNVAQYNEIVRRINALYEIRISNAIRYPRDLDYYPVKNIIKHLNKLRAINIFTGIDIVKLCYVDVYKSVIINKLSHIPNITEWNNEALIEQYRVYLKEKYRNLPYKIEFINIGIPEWSCAFNHELYRKDFRLLFD
jgi:hypothetical protein